MELVPLLKELKKHGEIDENISHKIKEYHLEFNSTTDITPVAVRKKAEHAKKNGKSLPSFFIIGMGRNNDSSEGCSF